MHRRMVELLRRAATGTAEVVFGDVRQVIDALLDDLVGHLDKRIDQECAEMIKEATGLAKVITAEALSGHTSPPQPSREVDGRGAGTPS
jgi:hypothetical protein